MTLPALSTRHRAYGLRWACDRPIPGLVPVADDGPPDVRVWMEADAAALFPPVAEEAWYVSPRTAAEDAPTVTVAGIPGPNLPRAWPHAPRIAHSGIL